MDKVARGQVWPEKVVLCEARARWTREQTRTRMARRRWGHGTARVPCVLLSQVRINADPSGVRSRRVDKLLQFFADEGCAMVEMTCEDHDYMAASTQFITHTVGRMLGTMKLKPTPINTQGYEVRGVNRYKGYELEDRVPGTSGYELLRGGTRYER
eukprot:210905-Chlamydomonas_euryale.AAC.1